MAAKKKPKGTRDITARARQVLVTSTSLRSSNPAAITRSKGSGW